MKEIIKQAIVESILEKVDILSGKFFLKETQEEIKDFKNWLVTYYKNKGQIIISNDVDSIVSTVLNFNRTERWYDLPIVKKAKELGACGTPLPFDLDDKQLTIINRLVYHPDDEVMFITTGVGGSGKSTFLNIIKQIFGNDCSSASLSDLSNSFTIAEAVKHRLICSDELAKGELNLPILKQLVSKQEIYVNPKHATGYQVKSQSALFYCCNKAPKIDVTDTGILRRIVFYERNTKIKKPDKTLNQKIYTEKELIAILRNALRFEGDDWFNFFEEETHKYLMQGNSVYLNKGCTTYPSYVESCKIRGLKAYSEPNWQEIKDLFDKWIYEDAKKYSKFHKDEDFFKDIFL